MFAQLLFIVFDEETHGEGGIVKVMWHTRTHERKEKKLNKNQNNKEKRIDRRQANIMAVRHRTKEREKNKNLEVAFYN